jgi:outer membrane receptor protein involved in Fe transport
MFDFFGSWSATERLRLRFGIDNLLDEDPEIVNQTAGQDDAKGSTLANYYDTLGGFDVGVLTASSTSFGASSSRSRGDSISSG